jgi:hypothetical protein
MGHYFTIMRVMNTKLHCCVTKCGDSQCGGGDRYSRAQFKFKKTYFPPDPVTKPASSNGLSVQDHCESVAFPCRAADLWKHNRTVYVMP